MSASNGEITQTLIPRRWPRFGRAGDPRAVERPAASESLSSLRAELLILREENARLKAAQHQGPGVGRLLERARSLPKMAVDGENIADETAQMLVESLVIRESLLEICQEIERSMVALAGRLSALDPSIAGLRSAPAPVALEDAEGHGSGAA
jgi:hypothetical protein